MLSGRFHRVFNASQAQLPWDASQPSAFLSAGREPAPYVLGRIDAVEWLSSLPAESVDLLVTDPPYESLEKHRAIGTTTRLKHSKASSNDWFRIFPNSRFPELFGAIFRVLRRNTHFYLFCDQETMFVAKPAAEAAGFKFWKPLVWDKCIAPDTPVWTTAGVVRADQLKPGDHVATPDGRDVAVLATRKTRSPVVRLALSDGTSIVCSTDHRLALSSGEVVEANSLKPGSMLAFAALPLANSKAYDGALGFSESIGLDYGLGKAIGLYAAEGTRTDLSVCFAFHQDEKDLLHHVSRVARSLGLETVIDETTEHGSVVRVCSKSFSALIGAFVGGHDAATKYLTRRALEAPLEFLRGIFDGLIAGDRSRCNDELRETYTAASLDLACFVLRFARQLGWNATIRPFENSQGGAWRVRFEPEQRTVPLSVVSIEAGSERELVDIAIDDFAQLYVLGNGVVSHNCKIGMGYHYRARYEFILFFEKGKRKLRDLAIPDVIQCPRIIKGYPTEKPVSVSELLIRQSSVEAECVVDPFLGSGSVGVAALRLGRRFMGTDISEAAAHLAEARLIEAAGSRTGP